MPTLAETLQDVRRRIQRVGSKPMNEENTKATLIDPVLRALGWNTEDLEDVQREYKVKSRDKPVDYALFTSRNVRLFVEAKALAGDLDDRRWANQVMGYATVAGVEWIVLTNGAEYRIYNAHAPVVVDEKLFRKFSLTSEQDAELAVETLELLAKSRLEENRIEVLWRAHFVDRQVRQAIEDLFSRDGSDMLLVNHVAKHTKNLTPEEIRSSIARCHITLDFPVDVAALVGQLAKRVKPRGERGSPVQVAVSLPDLIAAGMLKPPVEVRRTYRDKELTATVLQDGRVRVKDTEYDSLSTAAVEAIRSATGTRRSINGWDFWQVDDNSKLVPLSVLRERLGKGAAASPRATRKSSG